MSRFKDFSDAELISMERTADDPKIQGEIDREMKHRFGVDRKIGVKYSHFTDAEIASLRSVLSDHCVDHSYPTSTVRDLNKEVDDEIVRRKMRANGNRLLT